MDGLRAKTIRAAARVLKPLQLARFPLVRKVYQRLYRSAVPEGSEVDVEAHGLRMRVDPHDGGVGRQLFIGRAYEPLTSKLMADELRPGMVAVDLGANIGYFTILMAARVQPTGRVLAFEPAPENVALVEKNLALNGFENTRVVAAACSDEHSRVTLHLNRRGKGLHTIGSTGGEEQWDQIEVESIVLDDFLTGEDQRPIDFVKIDIEGAELRALRGMEKLLTASPNVRILTEINPTALAVNGDTVEGYLDLLGGYGLEPVLVVDEEAAEVSQPDRPTLLEMCARRPREVKHWNCNVLLARK